MGRLKDFPRYSGREAHSLLLLLFTSSGGAECTNLTTILWERFSFIVFEFDLNDWYRYWPFARDFVFFWIDLHSMNNVMKKVV